MVIVTDEQSSDLGKLIKEINKNVHGYQHIEEVLNNSNQKELLKEVWNKDAAEFFSDQRKNGKLVLDVMDWAYIFRPFNGLYFD